MTMHALVSRTLADLLRRYEWEVLSHAPYSPDMCLSDLLSILKELCFSTLKEISDAVTHRIRQLNRNGELAGISNLPRRWESVIEKQVDYIEGL